MMVSVGGCHSGQNRYSEGNDDDTSIRAMQYLREADTAWMFCAGRLDWKRLVVWRSDWVPRIL